MTTGERGTLVARRRSAALTDGELRLMHVLWDRGHATVGEVVDGIPGQEKPAYNTVLTILRILERKGYVTHEKDGRAHVYVPLIDRSQARRGALSHLLNRFFDDSPELLVLNLLEDDRVDGDDLRRVRELLDEREGDRSGSHGRAVRLVVAGTAIALAVALALRLDPRTSAATRHLVWWVTLACVGACRSHRARSGGGPERPAASPVCHDRRHRLPDDRLERAAPPDWVDCARRLGAWLGIVTLASVRIVAACSTCVASRGRRSRCPPIAKPRSGCGPLTARRARDASCACRADVTMPCALGLGPATILVPRAMLARLDDEDLDKVVMHERAHLVRYDDWTRLLQAVVTAVVRPAPAVPWIGRQLDVERETACDDLVVQATGDARAYASCLAEVASAAAAADRLRATPTLASGAMRSPGCLERRVGGLIDRRHNGTTAASRRFRSPGGRPGRGGVRRCCRRPRS